MSESMMLHPLLLSSDPVDPMEASTKARRVR